MTGYHRTHHTQGSRIIYINSEDADTHHTEHTTHFTISFKDALHTRPGEARRPGCRSAGEVVRVDRPLLWRIMIVGMKRYYWLIVW
jgi:hypothetical protein